MSRPDTITQLRGLVRFWKTESRQWERLFKKQRGGAAFDSIQSELAAARMRIRDLEAEKAARDRVSQQPQNHGATVSSDDYESGFTRILNDY